MGTASLHNIIHAIVLASLALTHSSYRNKVHHEGFAIEVRASQIPALIDDILRDHFKQGDLR